jgi:predicted TIM-barrel fold metal-dependent hydrolase
LKGIAIVDGMVNVDPSGDGLSISHIPLDAFRDDESREAWPSTGVVQYLFKDADDRLAQSGDPDYVDKLLDRWNIERGQVVVNEEDGAEKIDKLLAVGDRWFFSVRVNPHNGMKGVRRLERLAREYPQVKSCSIAPHALLPTIAPNSKEYYPVYAKCVELDLPVLVNVGIPGPRVPGETQNPIHLDEVLWFFPDLTVVMKHGGEPWVSTCVKLMLKWPNLYYMTSAFAPKYYPPEIIHYANTRGSDRIIFAGYWPLLSLEQVFAQVEALPLRDHVWEKMFSANARRVFKL